MLYIFRPLNLEKKTNGIFRNDFLRVFLRNFLTINTKYILVPEDFEHCLEKPDFKLLISIPNPRILSQTEGFFQGPKGFVLNKSDFVQ